MICELFIIIICLLLLLCYKQWELCKMNRQLEYYRYQKGIDDLNKEEDYEW